MEHKNKKLFKLKVIFYILVIFLIIPFFLILFLIPFSIYRYFVVLCSKFLQQFKNGRIISNSSAVMASDNIFNVPDLNLVLLLPMENKINLDQFKFRLNQILQEKNEKGEHVYGKLCQTISRFMGYNFWTYDPQFNINAHFRICDEFMDNTKLDELLKKLTSKSWEPKRPLWELVVFNNFIDSKIDSSTPTSLIIFTAHHALADGSALVQIFGEGLGDKPDAILSPEPSKVLKPAINPCSLFFKAIYEKASQLAEPSQSLPWELRNERRFIDKYAFGEFDVNVLKNIRYKYNVSFTAVILAGIAGSVRKIILENNQTVPDYINWFTIIHRNKRKEYLTNHTQTAAVQLFTGIETSDSRLVKIDEEYKRILTSTLLNTDYYIGNTLCSLLPNIFLKNFLTMNLPCIGGISNFPSPSHPISICGANVRNVELCTRGTFGFGIFFGCLSYNGRISIRAGVDQSIGDFQTSEKLVQYFKDELNILKSNEIGKII